jgi:hypothetical protein
MDKARSRLEAEIAQGAASFRRRRIVGEDHLPFAGGDKLVRVKAEGADVAEAPARATFIGLAVHFRRIFDDPQPVPPG